MRNLASWPALAAVAAAFALVETAGASMPGQAWVTDGPVRSVAVGPDGTTYVGGTFTRIAPATGALVALDTVSGGRVTPWPRVEGVVHAVAADGSGGWIVGGSFARVDGEPRGNLARIRADGTLDPAWLPRANGPVLALAAAGGVVLAGGSFTAVDGEARTGLAALGLPGGALLRWGPTLACPPCAGGRPVVRALALVGDRVYAGGSFELADGESRPGLVALDRAAGAVLAWLPERVPAEVRALAATPTTVLAGGLPIGTGSGLESLSAATGAARDTAPTGGAVEAIAVAGDVAYLGGSFTALGVSPRSGLGAIALTSGQPTAWAPIATGAVHALALVAGKVVAGGELSAVSGTSRRGLALLDAVTGALAAWAPEPEGAVLTLAASGRTLVAGGELVALGATPRRNAAALGTNGAVLAWRPDPDGPVTELAASAGAVYLAGSFAQAGGGARAGAAGVDPLSGAALPWNPRPDGAVTALAIVPGGVVLGGGFGTLAGTVRPGLGLVDAATGTVLPWQAQLGCSGCATAVADLALAGDSLAVAGTFDTVGGSPRAGLAAIAAGDGSLLPWSPAPGCGGCPAPVSQLAADGSRLYASGPFHEIDGEPRPGLAAFELPAPGPLAWEPPGGSRAGDWGPVAPLGAHLASGHSPDGPLVLLPLAGGATVATAPAVNADTVAAVGTVLAAAGTLETVAGTRYAVAAYEPQAASQRPSVVGTRTVGSSLRCRVDVPGAETTVVWLRDGDTIPGTIGTRLVVTPDDGGHRVACRLALASAAGPLHVDSWPVTIERPRLAQVTGEEPVPVAGRRRPSLALLAARATVNRGGVVRVPVSCDAGGARWCSGSVSLLLPRRPGRTLAGRRGGAPLARVIARRLIALPDGATRELRLDLTGLGMRQARRPRGLAAILVVRLEVPGEPLAITESRLRLRR